jgi:hypothetical protein
MLWRPLSMIPKPSKNTAGFPLLRPPRRPQAMSYKYCCDEYTDAVRTELVWAYGPKWWLGAGGHAAIEHCPWCGVTLRPPPGPLQRSTMPRQPSQTGLKP